jgi:hypothetical protein
VCLVSKDLSDRENSRGRATVAFFFAKAWLILTCDPCSPRETLLAKQHGKRSSHNRPVTAAGALEQSQFAAHRIPRRRDSQHELCAIVGNAFCKCLYAEEHKETHHEAAQTYF